VFSFGNCADIKYAFVVRTFAGTKWIKKIACAPWAISTHGVFS
jgi:hypothetical protein